MRILPLGISPSQSLLCLYHQVISRTLYLHVGAIILPSVGVIGDALTSKIPTFSIQTPVTGAIGGTLNIVHGGVETGLKGLSGAADAVRGNLPQIPVNPSDGFSAVKGGLKDLKEHAGAALGNAPKLPGFSGLGNGSNGAHFIVCIFLLCELHCQKVDGLRGAVFVLGKNWR